jgi:hypothetical protein
MLSPAPLTLEASVAGNAPGATAEGKTAGFTCSKFQVRTSSGKLAQGLDVRGVGGYAIVPPSIREDV